MVHIVAQYTVYGTYCGSVYSIWYILWLSIQYMVHIVTQYTVYDTYCGSVYSIWYILWLSIQYMIHIAVQYSIVVNVHVYMVAQQSVHKTNHDIFVLCNM